MGVAVRWPDRQHNRTSRCRFRKIAGIDVNSIGERTEPCGTKIFIPLSLLPCMSLVCTTKLRFDNLSTMKPTGHVSIRDVPKQFQVEYTVTQCHMQLSSPETLPQLYRCAGNCLPRCAESCLRCLVLVVLLGPPLI